MANIKSQKKRALTNLKRNAALNSDKSQLKTAIKAVLNAVDAKDKEVATVALNNANTLLDKAINSSLKHKNYVARQKSRLSRAVNSI